MTTSRGLLAAAVIVILVLLALWQIFASATRERGLEFAPDMWRTPAARSLSANSVLPGGLTNQSIVPGVVIHGTTDFDFGTGPDEAARAGREIKNPLDPGNAAALARGQVIFGIYCAVCHGTDGETPPPVVQRGMIPPPSLKATRAMTIKDGEVFFILTRGQGNMPSYAAQLPPVDRWAAVLALRALQKEVKR